MVVRGTGISCGDRGMRLSVLTVSGGVPVGLIGQIEICFAKIQKYKN